MKLRALAYLATVAGIVGEKWHTGSMGQDALKVKLSGQVEFQADRKPAQVILPGSTGPNDVAVQTAFRNARAAIMRSYIERARGFGLPAERNGEWKQTGLVFDAAGVRAG